jgi:hypothetical protein
MLVVEPGADTKHSTLRCNSNTTTPSGWRRAVFVGTTRRAEIGRGRSISGEIGPLLRVQALLSGGSKRNSIKNQTTPATTPTNSHLRGLLCRAKHSHKSTGAEVGVQGTGGLATRWRLPPIRDLWLFRCLSCGSSPLGYLMEPENAAQAK